MRVTTTNLQGAHDIFLRLSALEPMNLISAQLLLYVYVYCADPTNFGASIPQASDQYVRRCRWSVF